MRTCQGPVLGKHAHEDVRDGGRGRRSAAAARPPRREPRQRVIPLRVCIVCAGVPRPRCCNRRLAALPPLPRRQQRSLPQPRADAAVCAVHRLVRRAQRVADPPSRSSKQWEFFCIS